MSQLFSALQLRDLTLKNRVVVSPMWQYAGERGFATDWHLMHLARFAEGGAGLVMQEGTAVERRGCGTPGDLGLWHDDFIPRLRRIVDLVKACGAAPGIQLMHAGRKARQRRPWDGKAALRPADMDAADWAAWDVVAPSPIALGGADFPVPREMSLNDIEDAVAAFGSAAGRADRAGYEVLEIHAAHGYLIHEFLSPGANVRTDGYGDGFEQRIRFLVEVLGAVRAQWPAHKPLFLRMSCVDGHGWEQSDSIELARRLPSLGVDLIDCSSGGISGLPSETSGRPGFGYQVHFAETLRREAGVATGAVGFIVHAEQAEAIIAGQRADLVFLGREHLHNPNWSLDAAQKLGVDPGFGLQPARLGFFLDKRARAFDDFSPSTHGTPAGMGPRTQP